MKFQDLRFGCLVAIGAALAVVLALPIGFGGRARVAEAPADPPAENDRPHELIQAADAPGGRGEGSGAGDRGTRGTGVGGGRRNAKAAGR